MKTIKDFKNTVKIYKSHKLKNGFISITYAVKLGSNACTNEKTNRDRKQRRCIT